MEICQQIQKPESETDETKQKLGGTNQRHESAEARIGSKNMNESETKRGLLRDKLSRITSAASGSSDHRDGRNG